MLKTGKADKKGSYLETVVALHVGVGVSDQVAGAGAAAARVCATALSLSWTIAHATGVAQRALVGVVLAHT